MKRGFLLSRHKNECPKPCEDEHKTSGVPQNDRKESLETRLNSLHTDIKSTGDLKMHMDIMQRSLAMSNQVYCAKYMMDNIQQLDKVYEEELSANWHKFQQLRKEFGEASEKTEEEKDLVVKLEIIVRDQRPRAEKYEAKNQAGGTEKCAVALVKANRKAESLTAQTCSLQTRLNYLQNLHSDIECSQKLKENMEKLEGMNLMRDEEIIAAQKNKQHIKKEIVDERKRNKTEKNNVANLEVEVEMERQRAVKVEKALIELMVNFRKYQARTAIAVINETIDDAKLAIKKLNQKQLFDDARKVQYFNQDMEKNRNIIIQSLNDIITESGRLLQNIDHGFPLDSLAPLSDLCTPKLPVVPQLQLLKEPGQRRV